MAVNNYSGEGRGGEGRGGKGRGGKGRGGEGRGGEDNLNTGRRCTHWNMNNSGKIYITREASIQVPASLHLSTTLFQFSSNFPECLNNATSISAKRVIVVVRYILCSVCTSKA